jgi:hypothetical protein
MSRNSLVWKGHFKLAFMRRIINENRAHRQRKFHSANHPPDKLSKAVLSKKDAMVKTVCFDE